MIPQGNAVKDTVMTRRAYTYVPSTNVMCTGDKVVPLPVQEMFAQMTGATVKKIDAGHSFMLSRPDEMVTLL